MRFPSFANHVWRPAEPAANGLPHNGSRSYRLESALPGAFFNAVIQAWWLPADPLVDALVFQHLLEICNVTSRRFSVLDIAAANDAINTALAIERTIPRYNIKIIAARAGLNAGKDHIAFAERRAAIELRTDIDTAEMEATYARLLKLRDLFLSNSAMVGLWWSQGEPDRMLHLNEKSDDLNHIVKIVASSNADSMRQDNVAILIGRFLDGLGPDHRQLLIRQLAKVFESYHQPGLSEELLEAQQGG